jgi:sigma-B regulation protein RsbU (phosphoserine phosphatase)
MKRKSIIKTAVLSSAVQAFLMVISCLVVTVVFLGRIVTGTYDEMNVSIAGAAIAAVDIDEMRSLAVQVDAVIKQKGSFEGALEEDDTQWLEDFSGIGSSDSYKKLWEELNTIRRGTSSTALDYVLIYPDENREVFIMDACDVNVLPCGKTHDVDLRAYRGQPREDFEGFVTRSAVYGGLHTDGIAVYLDAEKGIYAYLLSDIPLTNINNKVIHFLLQTSAVAIIVTILICAGIVASIKARVIAPLKKLTETAEAFVGQYELRSENHDENSIFENVYNGDIEELYYLASSLQSMELEIGSYLRDIDRYSMERARLDTELDLARKIQAGVLSTDFDPVRERSGADIFATMAPAKEVGGDFYDFFFTDPEHLCLVIADVSGKGVPAALFMMIAKALIKNRLKSGDSPSEALYHVNRQICEYNLGDMFVTVWACMIELSTGKAVDVNAGHEHPVIRHEGGEYELIKYKHNTAIGVMEDMEYNEHEFYLKKGDMLFVYTDGLPEATDRKEEMFGSVRMLETLNRYRKEAPKELLIGIRDTVGEFVGEREPFDDLTMMALEWGKTEQKA